MFEKETIGKNLNRIRESRHMTIEDLAEATHFSTRSVCDHVKKGINSVDSILVYCKALNCEPAEMFADDQLYSSNDDMKKTDIELMNLTTRSYNQLRRRGIYFVEDLDGKPSEDLMKIRSLGRKSVVEIILKAKNFGVHIPLIER